MENVGAVNNLSENNESVNDSVVNPDDKGVEVVESSENCSGEWRVARLTNYESYPDPNSEECLKYSGCEWAGQFFGLEEEQDENWVMNNNIIAVHEKDWNEFGMKKVKMRLDGNEIIATAYDVCSDSDCEGCCTNNLGPANENGGRYLIDIEKYTMERFGVGDGDVKFLICE